VELPYGGDMQAAMKARDRDAIKLIMKVGPAIMHVTRTYQSAASLYSYKSFHHTLTPNTKHEYLYHHTIQAKSSKASSTVVAEALVAWHKFEEAMSTQLEEAHRDAGGTVFVIETTQGLDGMDFQDGVHLEANMTNMLLTDRDTGSTRQLLREARATEKTDAPCEEDCWLCHGSGRTRCHLYNPLHQYLHLRCQSL